MAILSAEVSTGSVVRFAEPSEQLAHVYEINRRKPWGLSDKHFRAAERSMPSYRSQGLTAATLIPSLPARHSVAGVARTFADLWKEAEEQFGDGSAWFDDTQLRSNCSIQLAHEFNHEPGLHWEIVDYGANVRRNPVDFQHRSAHDVPSPFAVLAAAVVHREWAKALNGGRVPYAFFTACVVTLQIAKDHGFVPGLRVQRGSRDQSLLKQVCMVSDESSPQWGNPALIERIR
jgi:hypothetical protein